MRFKSARILNLSKCFAVSVIFLIGACSSEDPKLTNKTEEITMPIATISTSLGDIELELDVQSAPITTKNFIDLANAGYYENTIFHRVIEGFMIQGGGLDKDMNNKPSGSSSITNEANNGLKNDRGTVAMARTNDPHSATSQFFINHKDNEFLNFTSETPQGWGYAVFGNVIKGMDIVDLIAEVNTTTINQYQDVPLDPITIKSVSIDE